MRQSEVVAFKLQLFIQTRVLFSFLVSHNQLRDIHGQNFR